MNKQNIRFTKLSDNVNALRTNEALGHCLFKPEVGERFDMYSTSLTPGGIFRTISTSPVVSMEHDEAKNITIISTMNSKYQIEYLP